MKNNPSYSLIFKGDKSVILLICMIIMSSWACERKLAEPTYIGTNYYPLNVSSWVIYDVDSLVYDGFLGEHFQYNYQVMELQSEIIEKTTERVIMHLQRFWRKNPNDSWVLINNWMLKSENNKILRTEENITYVKLAFPLSLNKSWNGNAYNNREAQNYKIAKIHQPTEWQDQMIDSTITVLQKDFTTLIGEELQYEVYATGIGMIEKHFTDLQKEIDGTIVQGVKYTYTLTEFGINEYINNHQ